jgi:hypothetical protein
MKTERFSLLLVIRRTIGRAFDKAVLWLYAKTFALMLAIFLCLPKRQRMSHNNGIAATGTLRIIDDPRFPAHEFFGPGKVYPCRIRHASATFLDDAMNCIRSISIKFSHHHLRSPFDIEMNSGVVSLFGSAVSFLKFSKLRQEKWDVEYQNYNRHYPDGLKGSQDAGRRHVSSFHNVHYYCKTPFLFIGDDGIKRYAKYRVLPFDPEPQTGLETNPSEWDQCNQRVLPTRHAGGTSLNTSTKTGSPGKARNTECRSRRDMPRMTKIMKSSTIWSSGTKTFTLGKTSRSSISTRRSIGRRAS